MTKRTAAARPSFRFLSSAGSVHISTRKRQTFYDLNLLESCVVLWKCPACTLSIAHSEAETEPRPGVTYRCQICRLELILDEATDKLSLAPLSGTSCM